MKNLKLKTLLIISSLLILIIYSIMIFFELFSEGNISMVNLTSIFGIIIVVTIFVLDKAAAKNYTDSKNLLYLLRFLIVFSTLFCGVLLNELIQSGFLSGSKLFWQLAAIILAIGSIVLIQDAQQRRFKSN
tara:strand:+ start:5357 stop:5749 length:393 start_codon:yes stop_codon:yes gene_type:complete